MVRVSGCALCVTFSVAVVVPLPEPGEMSAHVTSVRAVHAQPAPVVIVNWNRPPFHGRDPGRPLTLAVHPDGAGDGLGDEAGDGLGEGLGDVGAGALSLPLQAPTVATSPARRTTPKMCLVTA